MKSSGRWRGGISGERWQQILGYLADGGYIAVSDYLAVVVLGNDTIYGRGEA